MKQFILKTLSAIVGILLAIYSMSSLANFESVWEKSVGWTIEETKIIDSFEHKGGRVETAFQGCEVGRIITFRDGKSATCNSNGYQYAYAPVAIILSKTVNYLGENSKIYRMIVKDKSYDIK
jgi:hypothetical protein